MKSFYEWLVEFDENWQFDPTTEKWVYSTSTEKHDKYNQQVAKEDEEAEREGEALRRLKYNRTMRTRLGVGGNPTSGYRKNRSTHAHTEFKDIRPE